MSLRLVALMLVPLVFLAACSPPEPVRIGFIGGLSGRVADLGISGRNGAALAVEMRNQAGGIHGRPVELLPEDDQQDPQAAKKALARLIERKVAAVVGPMTSAMAVEIAPLADQAGVLLMSPTVTTNALSGKDDHFFRVASATAHMAGKSATHHFNALGLKRVAAIFDERNKAYATSWIADYRQAFEAAGGKVAAEVGFGTLEAERFLPLAQKILAHKPDGVLIIANSVDTAMLAQQIRKLDQKVAISTSEWAATERLVELGGKAVEGISVAQFIDRESSAPAYAAFRKIFLERFGQEPGFAGLAAFDAANVVMDALAGKPANQTLKQVLLARKEFAGAQNTIRFDAHGDSFRETYMTTIRNGAFVRVK